MGAGRLRTADEVVALFRRPRALRGAGALGIRRKTEQRSTDKAVADFNRVLDASLVGKPPWTMQARLAAVSWNSTLTKIVAVAEAIPTGDNERINAATSDTVVALDNLIAIVSDVPLPGQSECLDALGALTDSVLELRPNVGTAGPVDSVNRFMATIGASEAFSAQAGRPTTTPNPAPPSPVAPPSPTVPEPASASPLAPPVDREGMFRDPIWKDWVAYLAGFAIFAVVQPMFADYAQGQSDATFDNTALLFDLALGVGTQLLLFAYVPALIRRTLRRRNASASTAPFPKLEGKRAIQTLALIVGVPLVIGYAGAQASVENATTAERAACDTSALNVARNELTAGPSRARMASLLVSVSDFRATASGSGNDVIASSAEAFADGVVAAMTALMERDESEGRALAEEADGHFEDFAAECRRLGVPPPRP